MDNNGWNDVQGQNVQNQNEQSQNGQNQNVQNQNVQNQNVQNQNEQNQNGQNHRGPQDWYGGEYNYGSNQYGTNQYGSNGYGPNGGRGGNGMGSSAMGITSMVLGVLSLVMICCCYIMSIPLGISAVIFGIVSMRKNEPQKGFAIAGIITGVIGFVCAVAVIILLRHMIDTGMYDRIMNEFYHEMGIDPKSMLR